MYSFFQFLYIFLAKSILEPDAVYTAAIFLLIDKFFDSMNGSFHKFIDYFVLKNVFSDTIYIDNLKFSILYIIFIYMFTGLM